MFSVKLSRLLSNLIGVMYCFCTYFDKNYLLRGLALYRSLERCCPSFRLWILCMDTESYDVLSRMNLPSAALISLADFERGDDQLLAAKGNRSLVEYYFTCTPSLTLYVLSTSPGTENITYLDADMFFFSDPAPVFDELGDGSIALIGHRLPPFLRHLEATGIYNVGWITFRRDENGLAALRWWRERCIEWCYDRVEETRCADQKYLDDWPERFKNVVVLDHKGANLAPWNVANYTLLSGDGSVTVDGERLVFYHFHGFRRLSGRLYDPGLSPYRGKLDGIMRDAIYAPYLREIVTLRRELRERYGYIASLDSIRTHILPVRLYRKLKHGLTVLRSIMCPDRFVSEPGDRE